LIKPGIANYMLLFLLVSSEVLGDIAKIIAITIDPEEMIGKGVKLWSSSSSCYFLKKKGEVS
jgi:hypothetical protein